MTAQGVDGEPVAGLKAGRNHDTEVVGLVGGWHCENDVDLFGAERADAKRLAHGWVTGLRCTAVMSDRWPGRLCHDRGLALPLAIARPQDLWTVSFTASGHGIRQRLLARQ